MRSSRLLRLQHSEKTQQRNAHLQPMQRPGTAPTPRRGLAEESFHLVQREREGGTESARPRRREPFGYGGRRKKKEECTVRKEECYRRFFRRRRRKKKLRGSQSRLLFFLSRFRFVRPLFPASSLSSARASSPDKNGLGRLVLRAEDLGGAPEGGPGERKRCFSPLFRTVTPPPDCDRNSLASLRP